MIVIYVFPRNASTPLPPNGDSVARALDVNGDGIVSVNELTAGIPNFDTNG